MTLLAFPAFAEEWGFAYAGRLYEKVDGERALATVGGRTSYVTNFHVRLYIDPDGQATNAVWSKTLTGVPVQNGNFAFEVAGEDERGVTLSEAFAALSTSGESRLTIGVTPFDRDHAEIAPRQELVAVPYAAFAADACGMRGDVSLTGTVAAAYVDVPTATFRQGATHVGTATFASRFVVPSLNDLADHPLSAKTIAVSNRLSAADVTAERLYAETADAQVTRARKLEIGGDLAVSGSLKADVLEPKDGVRLAFADDVSAGEIEAAKIEIGGKVNLFDFKSAITVIPYDKESGVGSWSISGGTGSWQTPGYSTQNPHNYFVSLSVRLAAGKTSKVSVAGYEVATLGVSGVTGEVWLPFQTFLKPGEKISWTGCDSLSSSSNCVRLVYREVGF